MFSFADISPENLAERFFQLSPQEMKGALSQTVTKTVSRSVQAPQSSPFSYSEYEGHTVTETISYQAPVFSLQSKLALLAKAAQQVQQNTLAEVKRILLESILEEKALAFPFRKQFMLDNTKETTSKISKACDDLLTDCQKANVSRDDTDLVLSNYLAKCVTDPLDAIRREKHALVTKIAKSFKELSSTLNLDYEVKGEDRDRIPSRVEQRNMAEKILQALIACHSELLQPIAHKKNAAFAKTKAKIISLFKQPSADPVLTSIEQAIKVLGENRLTAAHADNIKRAFPAQMPCDTTNAFIQYAELSDLIRKLSALNTEGKLYQDTLVFLADKAKHGTTLSYCTALNIEAIYSSDAERNLPYDALCLIGNFLQPSLSPEEKEENHANRPSA